MPEQRLYRCNISFRNLLQRLRGLLYILRHDIGEVSPSLLPYLILRFEVATPKHTPDSHRHSLIDTHRYDVSFEIAFCGGPFALIDGELAEAMLAGIDIVFDDDPGRSVKDVQV